MKKCRCKPVKGGVGTKTCKQNCMHPISKAGARDPQNQFDTLLLEIIIRKICDIPSLLRAETALLKQPPLTDEILKPDHAQQQIKSHKHELNC